MYSFPMNPASGGTPARDKQKNQHGKREKRRPSAQAAVIVDFFAADGLTDGDDDGERPEIGEQIRQEVEQIASLPIFVPAASPMRMLPIWAIPE